MPRREEGAVAVIVAIVLLVFVAAVALAVDVGGLMLHRRGLGQQFGRCRPVRCSYLRQGRVR